MDLGTFICPDCGAVSRRKIEIGLDGSPFWVCDTCGVLHDDRSWFHYIDEEKAERIINTRKPLGLFVLDTGAGIIGIDNSTGDAWTEDFPDMTECLLWLARETEF